MPAAPPRVKVLLPLPLAGAYDYLVDDDAPPPAPGTVVSVPLGPRVVAGVVWDDDDQGARDVDTARLKPLAAVHPDLPPLDRVTRRFVDWVASYYLRPAGDVLAMVLRRYGNARPPRPVVVHRPTGDMPQRMTPARRRVLEQLDGLPPMTAKEIAELAGVGEAVVRGLVEQGALERIERPADLPLLPPDPDHAPARLDMDQRRAADTLLPLVGAGFATTLLEGVTGAGKTAVYCEAVAEAVRQGRQVLVLLPEIALTRQIMGRFTDRFGVPPVAWHSGLGDRERGTNWRAIVSGEARIVVGARSALFLPFPDLGLVIVDEEHDGSYKQEDGLPYHARDMAVLRASLGQFPAILVSATPSLESLHNVAEGRYAHVTLSRRYGTAELPEVRLVDLRVERPEPGRWISPPLEAAVRGSLAAGEQALLFLNRRGYAPLTLCDACGYRLQCPHCTAWLVEHRYVGRLVCHHCGFTRSRPNECPSCGAEGRMKACGPGIERLAEEASVLFPGARIALMTSDLVGGPAAAQAIIDSMAAGETDLLIGTQIVAKGHHFPGLTTVGVVDADLGLEGGDLRAAERTWQLLHQVSGRAGRAGRRGTALIQTHLPEAPVLQALAAGDSAGFVAAELDARRRAGMPPHGRLVALVVSATDAGQARDFARDLARRIPPSEEFEVLGPAPAPIAVVRGRHRLRFLAISRSGRSLRGFVSAWLDGVRPRGSARLSVDVDPQNFL
ncbi:MAG: primosomal protein N' [Pseudomonadota bacterium]|nr:primosomal protein N' [Pseudomonadota bacterium]